MQKFVPMSLVPVAAVIAVAIFFLTPIRISMAIYPLVRQVAQAKLAYETRHFTLLETEHFTVRYRDGDHEMAQLISDAAEQAVQPVTDLLGFRPHKKTLLIIYPNRHELRKAFGWSGEESAMGVYWGGVIQVLSPRDWMKSGVSADQFSHSGPMVHEFTHLVFDHLTRGNYPRWFTEGLAQYAEFTINGYEWLTATNSLSNTLHPLADLEARFDEIPNQSLVYRESFAAVRYIAEVYGDDALRQIITQLRSGHSMEQSIQYALATTFSEYDENWKQWAAVHMNYH